MQVDSGNGKSGITTQMYLRHTAPNAKPGLQRLPTPLEKKNSQALNIHQWSPGTKNQEGLLQGTWKKWGDGTKASCSVLYFSCGGCSSRLTKL